MPHDFEVAVSRYTFAGNGAPDYEAQEGLRLVDSAELRRLIGAYQLRFIKPTLHADRAVAIGSPRVLAQLPTPAGARTYYGMIIQSIDGQPAALDHIPLLAQTFMLEPRNRFIDPASDDDNAAPSPQALT